MSASIPTADRGDRLHLPRQDRLPRAGTQYAYEVLHDARRRCQVPSGPARRAGQALSASPASATTRSPARFAMEGPALAERGLRGDRGRAARPAIPPSQRRPVVTPITAISQSRHGRPTSPTSPARRHRPWMPTPGQHENEGGQRTAGLPGVPDRFDLPRNRTPAFRRQLVCVHGRPVRFVALNNDDALPPRRRISGLRGDNVPGYRASASIPISAATAAGYNAGGWMQSWQQRARTRTSTGSWSSCIRWRCPLRIFNGADLESGSSGCRCSTSTALTWCWPARAPFRTVVPGPRRTCREALC